MQLSFPMFELALPVTIAKADLRQKLGISENTLRYNYLTDEFYREGGFDPNREKLKNLLHPNLTRLLFEKYPAIKNAYLLEFFQNPAISPRIVQMLLQARN